MTESNTIGMNMDFIDYRKETDALGEKIYEIRRLL